MCAVQPTAETACTGEKDTAGKACENAKLCSQSMPGRVERSVFAASDCIKRNPLAVFFGALGLGVAIGCTIALARRDPPTLRERFAQDPLKAARDTLHAALAPVAHQLHEGYGSARNGASKVMNGLQRTSDSWAHQLGRAGSNLKFW